MREIKFRAFDRKLGMFSPPLIMFSNGEALVTDEVDSLSGFFTCDLMQYTGLKDCNDKEIYEGDILLINDKYILYADFCEYTSDAECQTEISHMGVALICKRGGKSSLMQIIKDKEKVVIIGNIHENPELLA